MLIGLCKLHSLLLAQRYVSFYRFNYLITQKIRYHSQKKKQIVKFTFSSIGLVKGFFLNNGSTAFEGIDFSTALDAMIDDIKVLRSTLFSVETPLSCDES